MYFSLHNGQREISINRRSRETDGSERCTVKSVPFFAVRVTVDVPIFSPVPFLLSPFRSMFFFFVVFFFGHPPLRVFLYRTLASLIYTALSTVIFKARLARTLFHPWRVSILRLLPEANSSISVWNTPEANTVRITVYTSRAMQSEAVKAPGQGCPGAWCSR